MGLAHIECLWLRGRPSEREIRRSEVRFLIGTQNFSQSHARDKTKTFFSISLPSSELIIILILFTKHDAIDIADPVCRMGVIYEPLSYYFYTQFLCSGWNFNLRLL